MTLGGERVEQVRLAVFDALEANDILFIDSSHAVKFGGDVVREDARDSPASETWCLDSRARHFLSA